MLHAHHEDIVKLNERFIWLRNHREDDDDQNDRQQSFERQIKFVAFLLIDQPMDGWNERYKEGNKETHTQLTHKNELTLERKKK